MQFISRTRWAAVPTSMFGVIWIAVAGFAPQVLAGPTYDPDRKELESVLEDLMTWLPGEWSSAPQVHYERTVRMPPEGEHENWYRTFARIHAPQIGPYVLYGQINIGGRDGPLYQRSQILYKVSIDEKRGVVLVRGQTPADMEKFVNLQDRPELWKHVRMRDEADIKCDFIWRRDGEQIVGVLDGPIEERRKGGPGTCVYVSNSGKNFLADAEWTLTPETLWLYDINLIDGQQFIGRKDRTHIQLFRARPYECSIRDTAGSRKQSTNDRGGSGELRASGGRTLQWTLRRARYPAADGFGLEDQFRLTFGEAESTKFSDTARAEPKAARIALDAQGARVECTWAEKFGPMPAG